MNSLVVHQELRAIIGMDTIVLYIDWLQCCPRCGKKRNDAATARGCLIDLSAGWGKAALNGIANQQPVIRQVSHSQAPYNVPIMLHREASTDTQLLRVVAGSSLSNALKQL